jgi:hypothetical protein
MWNASDIDTLLYVTLRHLRLTRVHDSASTWPLVSTLFRPASGSRMRGVLFDMPFDTQLADEKAGPGSNLGLAG